MIHAGLDLARRLERAEARNGVACAEAHEQLNAGLAAAVLEVGGGFAIFVGPESPLTHAVGMGMKRPVRAEEMDRMEEFYRTRGADSPRGALPAGGCIAHPVADQPWLWHGRIQ